jgi:hypothetical protein
VVSLFITRETVAMDTPAMAATSRMVLIFHSLLTAVLLRKVTK